MSRISNFSKFKREYNNSSILLENANISPSQQIYTELESASCGGGTDSEKLREISFKYTSKAIFDQVEQLLKQTPLCSGNSYESLQDLLNGECGRGDLDVVTAFAQQLNRIPEIGMSFQTNDRGGGFKATWRFLASMTGRRSGYQSTYVPNSIQIKILTPEEQKMKNDAKKSGGGCSPDIVNKILQGLKSGSRTTLGGSLGTDEETLQKTAKLYTSKDCFLEVEKSMKATPVEGYKSLQELLNGELGGDDLDVVTSFQTELEKIGIKLNYSSKKGLLGYAARFVEDSIKIEVPPQPTEPDKTGSEGQGVKTDSPEVGAPEVGAPGTSDQNKKAQDGGSSVKNKEKSENKEDKKQEKKDGVELFSEDSPEYINKRIIELIKEQKIIIDRTSQKRESKEVEDVKEIEIRYKSTKPNKKSLEILVEFFNKTGYESKSQIDLNSVDADQEVEIIFSRKDKEDFEKREENNTLRIFLYFYYKGDLKDRMMSKSWVLKGENIDDQDKEYISEIVNAISWRGELIDKTDTGLSGKEKREEKRERRRQTRQERKKERKEKRSERKQQRSERENEEEETQDDKSESSGSSGFKYESYLIKDYETFRKIR